MDGKTWIRRKKVILNLPGHTTQMKQYLFNDNITIEVSKTGAAWKTTNIFCQDGSERAIKNECFFKNELVKIDP